MKNTRIATAFRAFLAVTLATLLAFPATALAAQPNVRVTECATSQNASTSVTKITIGDVNTPKVGSALDDTATVSTAKGQNWEIPVLWIDSSIQLATTATEGQSYLPALAFYLPNDYAVGDADTTGAFTITFSPELASLFGDEDVVSVYNAATGITYILPASLRNFFTPAESTHEQAAPAEQTTTEQTVTPQSTSEKKSVSLVDLYCSQTAKDALSYEELEYLVDLILNKLEPQAVNLLREKLPAFAEAVEKGEIGTRIGLYIYYKNGDKDGIAEHENASSDALAYVYGSPKIIDGSMKYAYILAVNAAGVCNTNSDGSVTIARTGKKATDLQNTLVHEMLHAYMDDYNRAGMVGAISVDTMVEDPSTLNKDQLNNLLSIRYPLWFIEGTASAVENVYQYRNGKFKALYAAAPSLNIAAGTDQAIYYNYLTATDSDGALIGFRLPFAFAGGTDSNGNKVYPDVSRYVSGYLATLYLSNLQAKSSGTGSAVTTQNGKTTVSSDVIRSGYNTILQRMHKGETLDQIIADISKDSSGTSLYASTNDFEEKFICGTAINNRYLGDDASIAFVTQFLNYMEAIDADTSRANGANGSILFDFDRDYAGPLDSTKNETSDVYKIVESNQCVESTVPNSTAIATGGKSQSGATTTTTEAEAASADDEASAEETTSATNATSTTTEATASTADETVESATTSTETQTAAEETIATETTETETNVVTTTETSEATSEELPLAAKTTEETAATE